MAAPWTAGGRTGGARRAGAGPARARAPLELLRARGAEIGGARLRPGEAAEIREQLAAAQHGEAIARGAAAIRDALDAEGGAPATRWPAAVREARALARLDPRFEAVADRLAGLEAELEDAAAEVRRLAEAVDHDPAALLAAEERLGEIYRLRAAVRRRRGGGHRARRARGGRDGAAARPRGERATRATRTRGCSRRSPARPRAVHAPGPAGASG